MKFNRLKLIPAVTFAVSGALLAALLPSWGVLDDLKNTIEEDRLTLNELNQLSERSSDLVSRTKEIEFQLGVLNNRILTPETALTLITDVEAAAARVGVTVEIQSFNPPELKTNVGRLELTALGTAADTLRFLRALEQMRWIVTFDTVSLSPRAPSERESGPTPDRNILMTLQGKTYWATKSEPR